MKTDLEMLDEMVKGKTLGGIPLFVEEVGNGRDGNQRYVLVQQYGDPDFEVVALSPKLQGRPMRWFLEGWIAREGKGEAR